MNQSHASGVTTTAVSPTTLIEPSCNIKLWLTKDRCLTETFLTYAKLIWNCMNNDVPRRNFYKIPTYKLSACGSPCTRITELNVFDFTEYSIQSLRDLICAISKYLVQCKMKSHILSSVRTATPLNLKIIVEFQVVSILFVVILHDQIHW